MAQRRNHLGGCNPWMLLVALGLTPTAILGCSDDSSETPNGTSGTAGASGTAGTGGTSGASGTAGSSGSAGTGGTSGSAGTGGSAGTAGTGGTAGSGGSAGSGGFTTGDLDADYCTPLAKLVCERAASCGCSALYGSSTLDVDACETHFRDQCVTAYAAEASYVAQGKARVLKERALGCVDALGNASTGCESPSLALAALVCQPWISGDEPQGASCEFPLCDSGQGACTAGTCGPLGAVGDPCNYTTCNLGLACIGGVCTAPIGEGQACTDGDLCGLGQRCVNGSCRTLGVLQSPCTDTAECAEGLVCQAGHCADVTAGVCTQNSCGARNTCVSQPTCIVKAGLGSTCASSDICADGFFCDDSTHTCTTLPGEGVSCAQGVLCAAGLACNTDNGVCIPLPMTGETCGFTQTGPFACADGLGCNGGTCGDLPVENQPCAGSNQCSTADVTGDGVGNDLGCDFTANGSICVLKKGVGESCQADYVCDDGLFCDFHTGTCATVLAAGSPCSSGNECGKAGSCIPKNGGGFACAPTPTPGGACITECTPGYTCAGTPSNAFCLREICSLL